MGIHDLQNDYHLTKSYMNYVPGTEQKFGDIISPELRESQRNIKIGLVTTGYFEFWHQYDALLGKVIDDAEVVRKELAAKYDIVYPGLVDTIDKAIEAGKILRDANVDMLVLSYRTFIPDVYMHQLLRFLEGIPVVMLCTQDRRTLNWGNDYCEIYRTSGIMAQVQIVAGFRKMGVYQNKLYAVAGSIFEKDTYEKLDMYIKAVTVWKRLKHMTIGLIGNVFRGMCDFEFDKTKVIGGLGPEVINISIELLEEEFKRLSDNDPEVKETHANLAKYYTVDGCGEQDIAWACRLSVAMEHIVKRFSLDGIVLLGQHFVEKVFKTEPYLGICELERKEICLGATEGDVLGLVAMIILKQLTGNTAFQLEYSEFDIDRNAFLLLGHGHADPKEARNAEAIIGPACEHWGHQGTGVCGSFVPKPGACTMAHFVEDTDGWRMYLHEGEILDLEPMKINETHAIVRVKEPILEFTEKLILAGLPHHAITARGNAIKEMEIVADLLGMKVFKID
jgi:L-arabinose isomerase